MSREAPIVRLWRSHYPAMGVKLDPELERQKHIGFWEGQDFALKGNLALVGVNYSLVGPGIGLLSVCGVIEDPTEVEWASLTPRQARAIARALNKAARLASTPTPTKDQPNE